MNERRIFMTKREVEILEGAKQLDSSYTGYISAIYVPLNTASYVYLRLYQNGSYFYFTYTDSFSTYSCVSTIYYHSIIILCKDYLRTTWYADRTYKETTTSYTDCYCLTNFKILNSPTNNHDWSNDGTNSRHTELEIMKYNSTDKDGNTTYIKITPQVCLFALAGIDYYPPEGVVFKLANDYGTCNTTGYYYV